MISESVQDLEERENIWEVYLYPDKPVASTSLDRGAIAMEALFRG